MSAGGDGGAGGEAGTAPHAIASTPSETIVSPPITMKRRHGAAAKAHHYGVHVDPVRRRECNRSNACAGLHPDENEDCLDRCMSRVLH